MPLQLHDSNAPSPRIFLKPAPLAESARGCRPTATTELKASPAAKAAKPAAAPHAAPAHASASEVSAAAYAAGVIGRMPGTGGQSYDANPQNADQAANRGRVPLFWPPEAKFILSALDAGRTRRQEVNERRGSRRLAWQTVATLRLFSDAAGAAPWVLYSRDVTDRSLGFITRHRLPLGYAGTLRLVDPAGKDLAIECIIHRCRETVLGWFEGAMHFNRCQTDLLELVTGS